MHWEDEHTIADSKNDFLGWDIIEVEDYKPGVKRVYMEKIHADGRGSFMIIFAKDEYTEGLVVKGDNA